VIQIDMTPARFAQLAAKLKATHGVVLKGDDGTISMYGAQADYIFDGTQLAINVTHAPFPFSRPTAENWLKGQINS